MKAILVLDMPETCEDCDLCFECRDCMRRPEDIPYSIEKFAETFSDDRMPWCPLRTLPEKRYFDKSRIITSDDYATEDVIEHFEAFGWNEFWAQLLGEEVET